MYKISLQEVFTIIAEEQARKQFKEFEFVTRANNFDVIFADSVAGKIASLNEFVGVPEPFKNYVGKMELADRIVVLTDTMGINGEYTHFHLHQSDTLSNEDFILSLTAKQREDCYVINEGKLESFMVLDNKVIYKVKEDDLIMEGIIEGIKNQVKAKEKEIQKLSKRTKKLGKELKELGDLIESILE
jgi:hypothetical protein